MKKLNYSAGNTGLVWIGGLAMALTGCTTYVTQSPQAEGPAVEPPPVVYASSPGAEPPVVEIQAAADFYDPLNPYGEWVVVAPYGRCWRPGRVDAGWRPYSNGHWQRTDAGWYWGSDEPWGWATYHYGRWDFSANLGWFWMPQTQWAPAWVTWREGGGYVGWAPLPPSARIVAGGTVEMRDAAIVPRAYVFVEERRLLEPVQPKTVIVNNTVIINKTVNITRINVVNKTVINEGPRPEVVERASGRSIQPVPIRELRRKDETAVVAREPNLPPRTVRGGKPPERPAPTAVNPVQAPEPRRVAPPVETTRRPQPPAPRPGEYPAGMKTQPKPPVENREVRVPAGQQAPEKNLRPEPQKPGPVEPRRERANPGTPPAEVRGKSQPVPEPGRGAVQPPPVVKPVPGEKPANTQMKSTPGKPVPARPDEATRKKKDENNKGEDKTPQPPANH